MDIILQLFESFGFVNESQSEDTLFFHTNGSSIEIDKKETVFIEDHPVLRVPTSDINAIACLAYLLTSRTSRANMDGIKSTEDLLTLVYKPTLLDHEIKYNDRLLEVFIKYQLLTKRNPDNVLDID